MSEIKKINREVKKLTLDLKQKEEIDQKVNYYKSILKAQESLSEAISNRISCIEKQLCFTKASRTKADYEKSKLTIEKLDSDNSLHEKKKFFEMWLERSNDYDKKFALITEECNTNFDEVEQKAKELSKSNIKLKSYIQKYDAEQNKDQKMKNEYYLLLKFEIAKILGSEFIPKK